MTTHGAENPQWDDARIALAEAGQVLFEYLDANPAELRKQLLLKVGKYESIPAEVRETLENLAPEERRTLKSFLQTLARNHFYLENPRGGLEGAY